MEIEKANILGYCMGVRRAVKLAETETETERSPGAGVFSLGPLIHNPQVLEFLREKGLDILEEDLLPESLEAATVIIRAHGISPNLEDLLRRKGARLVDATCPRVRASQLKARDLSQSGYTLFLAGEKKHGEIIGLKGCAPGCIVVENAAEAKCAAEALKKESPESKCALIGQTTISPEEYAALSSEIRFFFPGLLVIDSICGATRDRQDALRELCSRVDAVIVAGGRESSNTRRLLAIAQGLGKPAWLVENWRQIPEEIARYKKIGISAGASTPDEVITEIEEALKSF